ncbi:epoxide hydrolase N terminus domain-containing protein [Trichoderma novae-zelandiae]
MLEEDTLKRLQTEWTTSFNWTEEQQQINTYHHLSTQIGSQKVHFIHEKSADPNAIPLILLHGWPLTHGGQRNPQARLPVLSHPDVRLGRLRLRPEPRQLHAQLAIGSSKQPLLFSNFRHQLWRPFPRRGQSACAGRRHSPHWQVLQALDAKMQLVRRG